MNIVVSGGSTPNKFGYDFVQKARQDGHRVLVLSHRSYVDTDTLTANFTNLENTVHVFQKLIDNVDRIDLFLYNSNLSGDYQGGWPNKYQHYQTNATVNEKLYMHGFRVHVMIPHALCLEALRKMDHNSKICFMTTDMVYDPERTVHIDRVGYTGGKIYQHQLMLALAEYNDVGATVSSVSPHFNYDNQQEYAEIFKVTYEHLISHNSFFNGKVFKCWK